MKIGIVIAFAALLAACAKDSPLSPAPQLASGEWGPIVSAQLSGVVVGNTLTFAVAVADTRSNQLLELGPFEVVHGTHASIVVCP